MSDYLSTVNLVTEYIEENLEGDLSLKAISKRLNYSAYFIQRIFSAVTHISIHDYITERRLIRAGEEILNGSRVVDAALKYGYNSHNGFTKAFEKKFGLPPSRVDECVNVVMDKPLRAIERDFYNTNGGICICHEIVHIVKLVLEGEIFTVDLKAFWTDEELKHSIEDKVISSIKSNGDNPTYCIGISNDSGSVVQYFVGKSIVQDANVENKSSTNHRFVMPKSTYVKFSYKGNFKENANVVIADAIRCFSVCGIAPCQDKIDHVEVFTKDYLETEVFDIMAPIK